MKMKGMKNMDVISLRRDLHQHPEVGFTEFWTASNVVEILQLLGYEVLFGTDALDTKSRKNVPSTEELDYAYNRAILDGGNPQILDRMRGGNTAVIGILNGEKPGPTLAFRFDMDALPINESSDDDHLPERYGFKSKYGGNMHACGHDAHTAIGLDLARKMATGDFSGTIKLIFQPAEEGGRGAFAIAQKGIVDDVDKIYCLHLGVGVPLGEISGGSTNWFASTKILAHFYGVPSHAAVSPEKGKNALLGASTALLNIHSLPRHSSGQTRINVGMLEGGTASNIIPHYAKMLIETRSVSTTVNEELLSKVKEIIKHSALMHGLQYEIDIVGQTPSFTCDKEPISVVMEEARDMNMFSSIKETLQAGGSEDAGYLISRVQENGGVGTYMIIGTTIAAPHHHHKFDIDESILEPTVDLLERIARNELRKKQ
jgi:aminobenzoyl-glutamate utilization protein A